MKTQTLIGICVLLLLVAGNTNGSAVEEEKKPWTKNEIFTLKSMKELFTRPRILGSLVKGRFSQPALAEDPYCPTGFRRGAGGRCREIW